MNLDSNLDVDMQPIGDIPNGRCFQRFSAVFMVVFEGRSLESGSSQALSTQCVNVSSGELESFDLGTPVIPLDSNISCSMPPPRPSPQPVTGMNAGGIAG